MQPTIAFYDPAVKASFDEDERDATLDTILTWSNRTLEYRHDYIQHLFPLPERSPVNPDAPIITKEVRDAFVQQPELRQSLLRAFGRMCEFYGFEMKQGGDGKVEVKKGEEFDENASQTWLTNSDHNHLRITRIIRSMRILGLETDARQFAVALLEADTTNTVSKTSATFWCRAALWPLRKPPSFPREREVQWLADESEGAETGEDVDLLRGFVKRRGLDV